MLEIVHTFIVMILIAIVEVRLAMCSVFSV